MLLRYQQSKTFEDGGECVQTLETLEPYYIKTYEEHIHIVLEEDHFTIRLNNEEYKFHPIHVDEIIINRKTQQIENIDDTVAFRKGEEIKYFKIGDLVYVPKFLNELTTIAEPYYIYEHLKENEPSEVDQFVDMLEKDNVKRLIDKALDDRNKERFYSLLKHL